MQETLTVCIPAFQCSSFIHKTIESLRNQSFTCWQALLSIDESDDDSFEVCKQLTYGDNRFQLFSQERRLGWAENINFLLKEVKSQYYMIHPHDDSLSSNYLQEMIDFLEANDDYTAAVGLLKYTGATKPDMVRDHNYGTPYQRISRYLLEERNGLLFRSVVRKRKDQAPFLLQHHSLESKGVDLVWIMELLLQGNAACIPSAVYFKQKWTDSVSSVWSRRSLDFRIQSVLAYTSLMSKLLDSTPAPLSLEERCKLQQQLYLWTLRHFVSAPRYFGRETFSLDELVRFSSLLFAALGESAHEQGEKAAFEDADSNRLLEQIMEAELETLKGRELFEKVRILKTDLVTLKQKEAGATCLTDPFSVLLEKARAEYSRGECFCSLLTLREIASMTRENAKRLHELSYEFQKIDALEDACDIISLACQVEPGNVSHWNRAGALYKKVGREEASEQALQRALKMEPGNESALYHLSLLYFEQGRLLDARSYISRAIELHPKRLRQEALLRKIDEGMASERFLLF